VTQQYDNCCKELNKVETDRQCRALIGAAGGTAYASGDQETDVAATGKAQERKWRS
jgi:hypothetical protein